jgi:molybdate transport system ATP-binding protein
VTIRHATGPLSLDLCFTLDKPLTVLFAPSGAGKTTVLRIIAGLETPDNGRIVRSVDGSTASPTREVVLLDTAVGLFVPPHRRRIRLVSQRPALFPHLSVLQNIRYGSAGLPRDEGERDASVRSFQSLLALCRVEHLVEKRPLQLSGGERQRVALARSLVAGTGHLLMLDEPFTGLEADLRHAILEDLRAYLSDRGIPVLMVTHDVAEVFASGAHVLRMEDGRIVASGSANEVLGAERDRLIERLRGV